MNSINPLVPNPDWGRVAAEFAQEIGRQTILCAVCVTREGNLTMPIHVVLYGGFSYCLDHLPTPPPKETT